MHKRVYCAKRRQPTLEEKKAMLLAWPYGEEPGPSYRLQRKGGIDNQVTRVIDIPRNIVATMGDGTLCDRYSKWANMGFSETALLKDVSGHGDDRIRRKPADIVKLVPKAPLDVIEAKLKDIDAQLDEELELRAASNKITREEKRKRKESDIRSKALVAQKEILLEQLDAARAGR